MIAATGEANVEANRGKFVVFEGIDGAGTTTQAQRLVDRLNASGRPAHLTQEPSDRRIGRLLRQTLKDGDHPRAAIALLFAADRLDHHQHEIAPKLDHGICVVSDRYVLSSLAYQSVDCPAHWVQEINGFAPAPDLTLLLDVAIETGLARISARHEREIFETSAFQRAVADNYLKFADDFAVAQAIVCLDGEQPVETVATAVWRHVDALFAPR